MNKDDKGTCGNFAKSDSTGLNFNPEVKSDVCRRSRKLLHRCEIFGEETGPPPLLTGCLKRVRIEFETEMGYDGFTILAT